MLPHTSSDSAKKEVAVTIRDVSIEGYPVGVRIGQGARVVVDNLSTKNVGNKVVFEEANPALPAAIVIQGKKKEDDHEK
jgi:hypothetical protein